MALEGSGQPCMGLWTQFLQIWQVLDGLEGFGRAVDGLKQLWTGLDDFGRLGTWVWSLLAACRMSEIVLPPMVGSIFC